MNNFKEVMAKRTDEQLIRIVTVERQDYQPEALAAAEEEVKARGIDPTAMGDTAIELKAEKEKVKQLKAREVGALVRLIHYVVDGLAVTVASSIVTYPFSLGDNSKNSLVLALVSIVFGILAGFGYFIGMESKFQKTIGKMFTGTSVVKEDGTKPDTKTIAIRTLCRLIPFDNVSYFFVANGFHDRLSNTKVIYDRKR